ncbi:putative macrophage migration inhibitory factor, Tautomerase/MIF superfamily [Helianthus annuus]|nr:putative macrophage migration inhibitory factor, Tautomerase/MIF superfamily [Helianthus annuus]KAJ0865165.1 putative macrophage migration inhibitory factor, Tautomerase/MIF superfamily [Helianthus annuus]
MAEKRKRKQIICKRGVLVAFVGTEKLVAYGEVISIDGLNPSVNRKLSLTIAHILQTKQSVNSSHFYIKFDVEILSSSFHRLIDSKLGSDILVNMRFVRSIGENLIY